MGFLANPSVVAVGKTKDGEQKFNIFFTYLFGTDNPPNKNITVGGLTLLDAAYIDIDLNALKVPANLPPIQSMRFNVLFSTTAAAPAGAVLIANNSGDLVVIPYDAAYDDAGASGEIPVTTGLVPFFCPVNSVVRVAAVPPNVSNPTQCYQEVQVCLMTYKEDAYMMTGKSSNTIL